MTNDFRRTLCDIDVILNVLPEEDRDKVPIKLRNIIAENKLEDYESNIKEDIPIEEQDVHPDTQTFLAMLYLNYWCEDEEEKKELNKLFAENEKMYEKELNEKYEVFKDNNNVQVNNNTQENALEIDENTSEENEAKKIVEKAEENTQVVVYKENIIKRIFNKIFDFFRRKEYGK